MSNYTYVHTVHLNMFIHVHVYGIGMVHSNFTWYLSSEYNYYYGHKHNIHCKEKLHIHIQSYNNMFINVCTCTVHSSFPSMATHCTNMHLYMYMCIYCIIIMFSNNYRYMCMYMYYNWRAKRAYLVVRMARFFCLYIIYIYVSTGVHLHLRMRENGSKVTVLAKCINTTGRFAELANNVKHSSSIPYTEQLGSMYVFQCEH